MAEQDSAPLAHVVRARDLLLDALATMSMPTFAQLEALAGLSAECRARAPGQLDALDRLVFRWRQRQTQREALVAQVRRGHRPERTVSA